MSLDEHQGLGGTPYNESDMTPELAALPSEERHVVMEYLENGGNKTKAYLAIWRNVPYDAARSRASAFFRKPHVKRAIDAEMDAKAEENKRFIKRNIWQRLNEVTAAKASDYIDRDGNVDFDAFARDNPMAIKEIKKTVRSTREGPVTSVEFKLADGIAASRLAADLLGLKEQAEERSDVEIKLINLSEDPESDE